MMDRRPAGRHWRRAAVIGWWVTVWLAGAAELPMPPEPWPEWGTGSVELAVNGQPRAVVVIAENPSRPAQVAAAEFIHYVRKMTGVELPLVVDAAVAKQAWQPRRVLIGDSLLTRAYGLRNEDFAPQEYLVATRGQDLVLMGRDADEFGLISYERNGLWPTAGKATSPVYTPMGSLYAVDTFLERACGVRWYLPEEIGEVCPRHERLLIGPLHRREKPWTRHRMSSRLSYRQAEHFYNPFAPAPARRVEAREMTLWLLRRKIGGEPFHAGHAFDRYAERFGEAHPEWWKDGRPTSEWPHPDYANPALIEQAAQDALASFAGGARYHSVTPNDGRKGLIWSDRGEALRRADPPGIPDPFSCGWASDFVFDMVNRIATRTRQDYPDRWIAVAAYAPYFLPPSETIGLAPGVAVCQCGFLHDSFTPERYNYYADNLTAWSRLTPELYVWEYYLEQAQKDFLAFPAIFPRQIARAMAHLRGTGVKGMFIEASAAPAPGGIYTDATLANPMEDLLNHYVTWTMLTDPGADVEAILAEHYRLFYGPAAAPMARFYSLLEQRWLDQAVWADPAVTPQQRFWELMYTDEVAAELASLVVQARQLAAAEPYRARVDLADRAILRITQARANQYRLQFAARPRLIATAGEPARFIVPDGLISLAAGVDGERISLVIGGRGPLADADRLVVALDPGRGRLRVLLLEIAPDGQCTGSLRQADKPPQPWEAEAEVTVEAGAPWSVTVRLPLMACGQPSWPAGQVWGINAVWQHGGDTVSWAPVAGRLDNPDEFGVLSLGPPGSLRYSFDDFLTAGVRDAAGARSAQLKELPGGQRWGEANRGEGRAGDGLRFLGEAARQYLQIDLPPTVNVSTDDFTIALWYRAAAPGGLLAGSTTTSPYYQFYPRGNDDRGPGLCFALNAGHGATTSVLVTRPVPELGDGQWHHYAAAVDRGRNLRLYVDGKLLAYSAIAGQRGALQQVVTIGGPYNYLTGDIDDLQIVQGAPDAAGVQELMGIQPGN